MTAVSETIVDTLYSDFKDLQTYLENAHETSHDQLIRESFRRYLIVAAASLFEVIIKEAINDFSHHCSNGNAAIVALIEKGITKDNYFRLFEWKTASLKSFFNYFGTTSGSLGVRMQEECGKDSDLKESGIAFLKLGNLRNILVHGNFAFLQFDQTTEEAYELFLKAKPFVTYLLNRLAATGSKIEKKAD